MRYCAAHWAPCAVWDKLHAIEQLFRKGYELVLYADGDAAVADWRRSPWDILLAAAQTLARPLPCFLVSTDRGHFGAFGKVNLGVMLLRNCSSTRRALEWVVAREKGHEEWPAEQEQAQQVPAHKGRGGVGGPRSVLHPPVHGRQRLLDDQAATRGGSRAQKEESDGRRRFV